MGEQEHFKSYGLEQAVLTAIDEWLFHEKEDPRNYVEYEKGGTLAVLDGEFTIDELHEKICNAVTKYITSTNVK